MNKNLTEKNSDQVNKLVQDCETKTMWQSTARHEGKQAADWLVARFLMIPVKTVKAARYYWS